MTTPVAIRTYSGVDVLPLGLDPAAVNVVDVAVSLSRQARFLGHTRAPYSVAQHSVAVSLRAEAIDPASALWGLLHDASEAYLGDVVSPLKVTDIFAAYRAVEADVQAQLYRRFGLEGDPPPAVDLADRLERAREFRDLVDGPLPDDARVLSTGLAPIGSPWSADRAAAEFCQRFVLLGGRP